MPLPKNILPKLDDLDIEIPKEDPIESYVEEDEFLEDLSDEDFGNFEDDDIVDFGEMIEDDEYSQMIKEQESEEDTSSYQEEEEYSEPLPTKTTKETPKEKPKIIQDILKQKPKPAKNKKLKSLSGNNPLEAIKKYKIPIIVLSSILVVVLILFIVMSFLKGDKSSSSEAPGVESPSVENAVEIGRPDNSEPIPKDKDYYIEEGKIVVKPKSDSKKFEYIEAAVLTEDGITRCVSFDIKLKDKHEPTVLNDCDIDLSGRTIENIIIFEKE